MAISKGNQPVNSFVKGLITEVSPLSFPDQASLDEVNFKLKHDGTRERRLGLDYEDGYTEHTLTAFTAANLATATQSAYRWINPNGSSTVEIGVIQVGRMLYFINLLTDSPSSNVLNGGVGIDTGVSNESRFAFTTLNNYLIAVNPNLQQPYLVSYNDVTDVISYETAAIKIRDLYGVDDDLRVDERPTVLSEKHRYNLRNQGWSPNIVSTCGTDALDCTFSTHGVYPSNADQWGIGRIADLANADVDKYDPNIAKRNILNNGQVPRGHYIIRAFFRGVDRVTASGISPLPLDNESSYITTVAGYAGRAWYSGIRGIVSDGDENSPKMGNAILYSQIFRSKLDLVKCYQENDPTSYRFADLIDTDGGVIHIPECSNIVKLMAIKHSLFVFAENGVWEIRGDDGGFRATSFQINKVSSVGVYSPQSIIEVNGIIYFWAITGIYSIVPNAQLSNIWDTTNITLDSIQRVYNSIPDIIKKGAKGYYDLKSNTARWLYASDYSKIVGNPVDVVDPVITDSFAIGTPYDTLLVSAAQRVVRISDTSYLILYKDRTTQYLKAVVVSIATALTVTIGTPVTIRSTDTGPDSGPVFNFAGYSIDTNKLLIVYGESAITNAYANILTIAGTTITVGAIQTLFATAGFSGVEVVDLSTTTALLTYNTGVAPAKARILSISGDTVTANAANNIGAASTTYAISKIDATRVVILLADPTNNIGILTISGTTVTIGTQVNLTLAGWSVSNLNTAMITVLPSDLLVSISAPKNTGLLKLVTLSIAGNTLTYNAASSYETPVTVNYNHVIHRILNADLAVCLGNYTSTTDLYVEINRVSTGTTVNVEPRQEVYATSLANGISAEQISTYSLAYTGRLNSAPYTIITGVISAS